jgi:hypothetical protein
MLKRTGWMLAAMIAVVGCGIIKIPLPGETNVRVGLPTGQTESAPITDGKVDRVIGSPVSLDRGSPVSLDGSVPIDKIGADRGSWSLKGAKLSGTGASVQGLKPSAAGDTFGITASLKLKFYQNDTEAALSCTGNEVYTALENISASATVDASGNIGDLGGTLSQANLNNLINAVKVIDAKTKASKVTGATPWKMLACVSGDVTLKGSPIVSGTLLISGFDFGLGLYYTL